jgi:hypothetical protein
MNSATLPYGGIGPDQPEMLRNLYGIRFFHFHDSGGRLIATLVTEPIPDVVTDDNEAMFAVAAGVAFQGYDPVPGFLTRIERYIRSEDLLSAEACLSQAVNAVSAIKEPDAPTRTIGRAVALGRLQAGYSVLVPESELRARIRDRSILREFPGGKRLAKKARGPRQPPTKATTPKKPPPSPSTPPSPWGWT